MSGRDILIELLEGRVIGARLEFRDRDGIHCVGEAATAAAPSPPMVAVRVYDTRFYSRVLAHGNLGLGEAYMERDFEVEEGTLHDLLTVLLKSRAGDVVRTSPRYLVRLAAIRLASRLRPTWRNARAHYDLGDDLFRAFLDPTLTYSCGYAAREDDSLADLQRNKFDRILRKVDLQAGERLLDIGCGYGGLLVHAARHYGARGTGVTNSVQHAAGAAAAAHAGGVADRVEVHCRDYREVSGQYDRIVCVGMVEHVPRRQYPRFFRLLCRALAAEGRGLLQTIGCSVSRNRHDPFFQKYVFPGSNQLRLSEIAHHLERNRLPILDVENIVRHYALTTAAWLGEFTHNRKSLDRTRYDERFQRMWEYYLCCGIAGSLASPAAVYQVLFARDHTDPVPLHRV